MRPYALIAAAGLTLLAGSAAAQSWNYSDRSHHSGGYSNAVPSSFDWRSQLDRPGDYRCDAFWDASRDDCDARWRDQRRHVSPQARSDYRDLAGYRRDGYGGYGYGHGAYGYGYGRIPHGGYGYGGNWGHGAGGTTYEGAYGRPDIVFPGSGRRASSGARDPHRIGWCRANYRSYDPVSGYYRAYSGELIFCG